MATLLENLKEELNNLMGCDDSCDRESDLTFLLLKMEDSKREYERWQEKYNEALQRVIDLSDAIEFLENR